MPIAYEVMSDASHAASQKYGKTDSWACWNFPAAERLT